MHTSGLYRDNCHDVYAQMYSVGYTFYLMIAFKMELFIKNVYLFCFFKPYETNMVSIMILNKIFPFLNFFFILDTVICHWPEYHRNRNSWWCLYLAFVYKLFDLDVLGLCLNSSPKNENCVIIYTPSSCFKPVCISFFY